MSGSMPVVSQSIIKLMVPVGASTVACALRNPWRRPTTNTWSHSLRAASFKYRGPASWIFSTASRCICITRSIGSRLSANASNGPTDPAISALVKLAVPCSKAVIEPHTP
jgi:hypothetical protein